MKRSVLGIYPSAAAGILFLAACAMLSGAKKQIHWERGTVLAQDVDSAPTGGTYAGPIGKGRILVPLYRNWNNVRIRSGNTVYQLQEVQQGRLGRLFLVVNGNAEFYRENSLFVFLDAKHKKHKFILRRVDPA